MHIFPPINCNLTFHSFRFISGMHFVVKPLRSSYYSVILICSFYDWKYSLVINCGLPDWSSVLKITHAFCLLNNSYQQLIFTHLMLCLCLRLVCFGLLHWHWHFLGPWQSWWQQQIPHTSVMSGINFTPNLAVTYCIFLLAKNKWANNEFLVFEMGRTVPVFRLRCWIGGRWKYSRN